MKSVIAAIVLAATAMSNAHGATITFDSLEKAGSGFSGMSSYSDQGFVITAEALASASQNESGWYAGSASLFNNQGNGVTTLRTISGEAFSLNAIDLAPVANLYGGGTTVSFTGYKHDGATVSQSFTIAQSLTFGTYTFTGFNGLDRVTWIQQSPYHQFDNILLNAAEVPEPASIALIGFGLAGLAAARRRKAAQAV